MSLSIEQQFIAGYDEYSDSIFRYCYGKTSNKEVAVDLVQDTFIKVWNYIAEGNDVVNLRALLYATARNLVIDYYRKGKELSLETISEMGVQFESNDHDQLALVADAQIAVSFIKQLDESYQEVLLLRFVEGLGPKDISSILGESENVISVRINRAVKKVRSLFKDRL